MDQWEDFTTHIKADMAGSGAKAALNLPGDDYPQFSPLSLTPTLNAYGAEGWELIAIHPLKVGRNGDFRYPSGASSDWGTHYFCTFKRRLS